MLMEWTRSVLDNEDWIGIDESSAFSSSAVDLFSALELFAETFLSATRKLEIRTLLAAPGPLGHSDKERPSSKWTVRRLRDSVVRAIGDCVDCYCTTIQTLSGRVEDVVPPSEGIGELNV